MRGRQATRLVRVLRHAAGTHGHGEVVEVWLGAARVPCDAEVVGGSRRLFWGYLVGGRKRAAIDDGYELVLRPGVFMIVETLPERRKSSLDLGRVRFEVKSARNTHTCNCRTMGLL